LDTTQEERKDGFDGITADVPAGEAVSECPMDAQPMELRGAEESEGAQPDGGSWNDKDESFVAEHVKMAGEDITKKCLLHVNAERGKSESTKVAEAGAGDSGQAECREGDSEEAREIREDTQAERLEERDSSVRSDPQNDTRSNLEESHDKDGHGKAEETHRSSDCLDTTQEERKDMAHEKVSDVKSTDAEHSGNGASKEVLAAETSSGSPLRTEQAEKVRTFVRQSGLDHRAEEALKSLRPELQDQLMEEGPIEGPAPLLVLMGRIRKVVAQASTTPSKVGLGPMDTSVQSAASNPGQTAMSQALPGQPGIAAQASSPATTGTPAPRGSVSAPKVVMPPGQTGTVLSQGPTGQTTSGMGVKSGSASHGAPSAPGATSTEGGSTDLMGAARAKSALSFSAPPASPRPLVSSESTSTPPAPASPAGTQGIPPSISVSDLVSAFVLQNALPPAAESALWGLPPEVALPVMRAGPLEGGDKTTILMQRVQQAMMEAQAQQAHMVQSQHQAPPPPPPQPVLGMHMQAQQMQGIQRMPQASLAGNPSNPMGPAGQMYMHPGQFSGQSTNSALGNQCLPPVQQTMAMQVPQAVTVQPQTMMAMQQPAVAADPLSGFCRQNGVDVAVEQVLRSAPLELQVRVMQEGALVGGNPSEVLIQRVRRMMGQSPC